MLSFCLFSQPIKSLKTDTGKTKIINHSCHFKVLTMHILLYLKIHKNSMRYSLILQMVTEAQELGKVA